MKLKEMSYDEWCDLSKWQIRSYRKDERLLSIVMHDPQDMHTVSEAFGYMSFHWQSLYPFCVDIDNPKRLFGLVRGRYLKRCLPYLDKEPIALLNTIKDIQPRNGKVAFYRNHFWSCTLTTVVGGKIPPAILSCGPHPPILKGDPLFQPFIQEVRTIVTQGTRFLGLKEMAPLLDSIESIAKHHGDIGLEMYVRMICQHFARGRIVPNNKHELASCMNGGLHYYGDFKIIAIQMLQ